MTGFEGSRELARALGRLEARAAGKTLTEAALAGAEPIREDASAKAPRRTGNLASNIVAEVVERSRGRVVVGIGPNKDAWYGIFPELGTSRSPAHPYLRPAFDGRKGDAVDAAADVLGRAVLEEAHRAHP